MKLEYRQTTSFNEFLNRGRHSASEKWRLPRHAGHIRAVCAQSSRCFCFTTYSTPSFLHPYSFLTYSIPYVRSRSHSQATHLSALSLIKDCLAVRLMASFRSACFTSSASFVVPVVSSDSTALLQDVVKLLLKSQPEGPPSIRQALLVSKILL